LPSSDKGNFTKPLPSNERGYTDTRARTRSKVIS
jgi:hypothetical protein